MKKKILALSLCIALLAVALIGGTLAYFTDTDAKDNVFTVGKIEIALHESNGAEGEDLLEDEDYRDWLADQVIVPAVIVDGEIRNALPKEVTISLEDGSNDAYVWYTYQIPKELDGVLHFVFDNVDDEKGWTGPEKVEDEESKDSVTYVVKYNTPLTADAPDTTVSMKQVYLDSKVDYEDGTYYVIEGGEKKKIGSLENIEINVCAYGIQADGFDDVDAAYDAYQAQWNPAEGDNNTTPSAITD